MHISPIVLAFSDRLRDDGTDCYIDQYINGATPESWQRWMDREVKDADFVLIVRTPIYLKRFNGEGHESGREVNFEGVIIRTRPNRPTPNCRR